MMGAGLQAVCAATRCDVIAGSATKHSARTMTVDNVLVMTGENPIEGNP